ncbi:MAG: hypothetical protein ABR559_08980 [Gemmatimonadota bacterium]
MKTLYLVDMLLIEERSATVLVEAESEDAARETALTRTPEDTYNCLDCESEVRVEIVSSEAVEATTEWGDYEMRSLLRIGSDGTIGRPLGRHD